MTLLSLHVIRSRKSDKVMSNDRPVQPRGVLLDYVYGFITDGSRFQSRVSQLASCAPYNIQRGILLAADSHAKVASLAGDCGSDKVQQKGMIG